MRAIWNDAVLAESDDTVILEGNHYFPVDALRREHFRDSDHHSSCPWKGMASYYDVVVGAEVNPNAAWYYPQPKDAAKQLHDHMSQDSIGVVAGWRWSATPGAFKQLMNPQWRTLQGAILVAGDVQ